MLRRKAAGSWWGALLLVAVWHRMCSASPVAFPRQCEYPPCPQTECLLPAQSSGTSLRAPCLRIQGVLSGLCWRAWRAAGTDLALGSVVCYGAGGSCVGQGDRPIQLRGTAELGFVLHLENISDVLKILNIWRDFWMLTFMNCPIGSLSYLQLIPMTLGLGFQPWYSQIPSWVITMCSLAKADRLPVVKWNSVCDVWNLGLQSIQYE